MLAAFKHGVCTAPQHGMDVRSWGRAIRVGRRGQSVEFVSLRYFHETARTGSIRRAAENLHVTPSSISRMIASLEQDLGTALFERSRQGMRLTAAGTILSRQTQRTFRDFERIRGAIDDLKGLRRGQVSIYAPEGLIAEFLPTVISLYQAKFPAVSFNVVFASTDRIVEAIIDDETDIGITFNGPERDELAKVVEYVEPLTCLVAPSHPLARKRSVLLKDILAYPLALPETSFGLRRMIDAGIRREKLSPQITVCTNSLELAKRMAMLGSAVAFMPRFMVMDDVSAGRLRSIRVQSPAFSSSRVAVCVHRDRNISYAARELVESLKRHFSQIRPHR